ncbi:MAG TPA: zinc-binding alcohol dehydrogenase [Chloroflexota bacterium]|nr:zinc-binding alcohol dehydrogenase [Chloroflexota bacterium]
MGRRVIFTGAHQAAWQEFAIPEQLGPSEVLLRTLFSVISVGTETAVYSKTHIGFSDPAATYPRYPFRPGYAATAEVEAVGAAVQNVTAGQVLCFPGPHSSHAILDLHQQPWAPLPTGLSPLEAAFSRLATISLNGVRLASIQLGDSACVLGAGLIGQFAAQFARLSGGRPVVIADLLESRLAAAQGCGIREIANLSGHVTTSMRQTYTGNHGFTAVIEATGAPAAVEQALTLTADYGRVVLLGSPRGTVQIDPYTSIHRPGVTIVGAHERTTPRQATIFSSWTPQHNLELVLRLLASDDLRVAPLVSHRLPASTAPQVYARLIQQPGDYLGVVLDWSA